MAQNGNSNNQYQKRLSAIKRDPDLLQDLLPAILRTNPTFSQVVELATTFPAATDMLFEYVRRLDLDETAINALLPAFPRYADELQAELLYIKQDQLADLANSVSEQQDAVERLTVDYRRTSADALRQNERTMQVCMQAEDALQVSRAMVAQVAEVGGNLKEAVAGLEQKSVNLDKLQKEVVALDDKLNREHGEITALVPDLPTEALIAAAQVEDFVEEVTPSVLQQVSPLATTEDSVDDQVRVSQEQPAGETQPQQAMGFSDSALGRFFRRQTPAA